MAGGFFLWPPVLACGGSRAEHAPTPRNSITISAYLIAETITIYSHCPIAVFFLEEGGEHTA